MPFDFDKLPRDAQRAFFAKLRSGEIQGGDSRKPRSGNKGRPGHRHLSDELRRRQAADRWVDKMLANATDDEAQVLMAIKDVWGTPGMADDASSSRTASPEEMNGTIQLAAGQQQLYEPVPGQPKWVFKDSWKLKQPGQQDSQTLYATGLRIPVDIKTYPGTVSKLLRSATWNGMKRLGKRVWQASVEGGWQMGEELVRGVIHGERSPIYQGAMRGVGQLADDLTMVMLGNEVPHSVRNAARKFAREKAMEEMSKYAPDKVLKQLIDLGKSGTADGPISDERTMEGVPMDKRVLHELQRMARSKRGLDPNHPIVKEWLQQMQLGQEEEGRLPDAVESIIENFPTWMHEWAQKYARDKLKEGFTITIPIRIPAP